MQMAGAQIPLPAVGSVAFGVVAKPTVDPDAPGTGGGIEIPETGCAATSPTV